jgi:signal transduction histidine kinase
VKIAHDLTASREAADALRRAQSELEDRVRQRTAELQQEQARVRGLLRRLVSAQEEQRARIARDMHDQLGQQLTALRLTLERGQQEQAAGRQAIDAFERSLALTAEINNELDFITWELRPAVLDDLGLVAALPRFIREWSQHYALQAEFRSSAFRAGDLSKEQEVVFYRIAQEALNNVLKHAHASRVDVVLETRDNTVTMVIADDGVGFDATDAETIENGYGLLGMQERATFIGAILDVESTPGQGTTIYVRCPREPGPSTEGRREGH